MMHIVFRGMALGALLILIVSIGAASATANTMPHSGVGMVTQTINANALKPAICNGLSLSSVVTGSGTFAGNSGNTLILGSSGMDTITGADESDGGAGNDVLIGGPGNDTCTGGLGNDTFDSSCETQIQ